MYFFNKKSKNFNPKENQWITVDPRINKCLNITIPSNDEIEELLRENNYNLISNDSIKTCDLGPAGRGIVATKRIPIGSALPYGGNIQFLVSGDKHSIECDDQNFENRESNKIEIRQLNFDLPAETLIEEFLDTIKFDIFLEYQKNKQINCRVALIWNENDKVWYLALAKQLTNAKIIRIDKVPELLNRLNKLQNNRFDLLKYNSENFPENLKNTALNTIVNFVKDYAKNPDHFCNGANSRFVLCINGENASAEAMASLIQHTPIIPMATAANGINMLPMRLTRKGKVTPQSIAILITTQDVRAGTQLTFNYTSTVEKFISKNKMVIFDKISQPINPLFALKDYSLTDIHVTMKSELILERLLTSSSDEIWMLIKKNPDLFEHTLSIATKNKHLIKNIIEGKTSVITFANKLYKAYMDKKSQLDFFSLLPADLDEKQSLAFLDNPHSAFNFLCNPKAVAHIRIESQNPAFNWHPYSASSDYPESATSAKYYSEKREKIYNNGLVCYKSEDFLNAINAWQKALLYSMSESRFTKPQPPELYQFGNYIYVSKTTLTIVWGLANAYKKSELFENALYFFNMAEYMIRADSKMAEATCNLKSILLRSNECREKLAVLENQILLVEEQAEYSFRTI
ncbi:MAG: hypothetical protein H0U70_10245 [Tatlockia sp.]|nr:hypothetical protein [Tatlockia sp.]